jgi:hypothetical protein
MSSALGTGSVTHWRCGAVCCCDPCVFMRDTRAWVECGAPDSGNKRSHGVWRLRGATILKSGHARRSGTTASPAIRDTILEDAETSVQSAHSMCHMLWHSDMRHRHRHPRRNASDRNRQGALAELASMVRLTDAKLADVIELECSMLMTSVFRDGTPSACIGTGRLLTTARFNACHET